MRVAAMCFLATGLMAGVAKAQDAGTGTQVGVGEGGPDPQTVRIRMGPFLMNPRLELKNLGVDTNVFNEPDDQNPKRDFTFTLTPSLDTWVRIGRSWTKFGIAEDLVWYQEYSDQRSANEHYDLSWYLPLNRLSFTFSPQYVSTFDRPGYDIDERVHHVDWGGTGTIEVRAFPKTSFGVTGTYLNITFDPTATYNGVSLAQTLNRTQTGASVTISHQLTPLTKLAFALGRDEERLPNSPQNNSDSNRAEATVSFDPHALLKGSAMIGYRDFRPTDPTLGGYSGLIAKGNLTYTLLGATRFQVEFGRDVQYSYSLDQPYYLQNSIDGSIAQQIFGPFDVIVRGGVAKLNYQDRSGAVVAVSNRVDTNNTFGGGTGYHLSNGIRIGFNVDYYDRVTDVTQQRYHGLKYGASATYDF